MANETPIGPLTVRGLRQALDEAHPDQVVVFAVTSQELADLDVPPTRAWRSPSQLESIELPSRVRSSGLRRPGHGTRRPSSTGGSLKVMKLQPG